MCMKKIFLAIFMVVWANGMFAQTFDKVNEVNDSTEVAPTPEEPAVEPAASSNPKEEMMRMWATFQQYAIAAQRDTTPIITRVPLTGRHKFARHNYITQRLEISLIGGKDGDLDEGRTGGTTIGGDDDDQQNDEDVNFGLNVGYSVVIVPGRINGDMLELNKLGWGYSFGIIASFDHQKDYGTTCDFLAKIGIEAGNGHKMGIGFDALIGTGKTAGDYIVMSKVDNDYFDFPYTSWCFKYGAQLWVRSSLLHASIENTDIRLFARYVYSKNPEDEMELIQSGIIPEWKEESWSFGLTFCYNF